MTESGCFNNGNILTSQGDWRGNFAVLKREFPVANGLVSVLYSMIGLLQTIQIVNRPAIICQRYNTFDSTRGRQERKC